jgi:O-antigen ligase
MSAAVHAPDSSTNWFVGTYRRRLVVLMALAVGLSLVMARLVLAIELGAAAGLAVVVTVIAIGMRPRVGVYVLFGVVLFFDGIYPDPLMAPSRYLYSSLQSALKIQGGILIPLEMLLLLTSVLWLAQATMRRRIRFEPGSLGRPMLLFTLALVFGAVRGLMDGANVNYIFWESRFLFCMALSYVLATNTIRTRAHVRTLITLIFVFLGISAVDGVWRKYALINNGVLGSAHEFWYSHDGVVVWGLLIALLLAQQVFQSGPRWQRIVGPFLGLVMVLTLLISERRAGLIAVMIALAAITFALVTVKRKAFLLIAVPGLLVAAVYLPLFWNNTGTLGQGARAVRSISSPDPRDASSNAWRDLEAVNVRATILSDPLRGIGFGRPFLQVVTVPDISGFEFWNYESHHDILWVWMKTGAVGFICFFALVLSGIARSIWLAKTLPHPELKTFALVGLAATVMSLVFCYVDLGLTEVRIPILLGVVLGTVGVLDRIRIDEPGR